jgi:hypothetical protein
MDKSGKFSETTMAKLRRRSSAHQNSSENLGIFCASVVNLTEIELSGFIVDDNTAGVSAEWIISSPTLISSEES